MKKGFVYSFIVILFMLLVLAIIMPGNDTSIREKTYHISKAVKALDNKLSSIQDDIGRGIYIVGFRTLLSMDDILLSSGNYFTDVDNEFYEIFMNGTYNGINQTLMQGSSFNNFSTQLEKSFLDSNLILDIIPNSISLSHSSPWHLRVTLNTTINFTNEIGKLGWYEDYIIYRDISIIELNDPLYLVETSGLIRNQIFHTNVTEFVNGNDVSNLTMHMQNSFYLNSSMAPSYLKRLSGDVSSDKFGIESLINMDEFTLQGLSVLNRSSVDYLYLKNIPITNKTNILGMPTWFYLDFDQNHVNLYGVEGITG